MLTTKQIGIIMFGLSIFLALIVVSLFYTVNYLMVPLACGLETCPAHQALPIQTALGLVVSGVLAVFSLVIFSQEKEVRIVQAAEKRKTEFAGVLGILTEDERKIVEVVEAQPGIQQNTLRLRTDLSKAKLSMLLASLEKRGIVKKEFFGKTNKVYLRK